MKKDKEKEFITVYWAPAISQNVEYHEELNMLYLDPYNMFKYLVSKRSKFDQKASVLSCPAFKEKMRNTFVFKSSIESHYSYETDEIGEVKFNPLNKNFAPLSVQRVPGLDFGPTLIVETPYIFFADSDLEASFSQPIFHPQGYTKYGSVVPGKFNIGSWFRPYFFEIQMWNKDGELLIKEDEPMFYVEFLTNKNIKLVRFKYTRKLGTYAQHCVSAPSIFGKNFPLIKRYKKFKDSRMNELILKEIKENILGECNE
jgi:hypothetical protein